ncbi:hypothetical protein PS903_01546 [Pseudomonas fluorescens]|nr:hypothetical protein PS903_01546 [Pseudomonas fluorescens]
MTIPLFFCVQLVCFLMLIVIAACYGASLLG